MTGRIHMIMPTESIASKKDANKTFLKRTLVLDCTRFDPYTGERGYENYPSFEFSGDKCAELDNYQVGQVVSVSFDLQGNKFVGSDGKERWFTSIRGYKIELKRPITTENISATESLSPAMKQIEQQLQEGGLLNEAPAEGTIDDLPF